MLKKMFMAFRESQKAVRSERLHQTLHRAKPQPGIEAAVKRHSVLDLLLAIVRDQLSTLGDRTAEGRAAVPGNR